jgi:hypothetical protein
VLASRGLTEVSGRLEDSIFGDLTDGVVANFESNWSLGTVYDTRGIQGCLCNEACIHMRTSTKSLPAHAKGGYRGSTPQAVRSPS